MGQLKSDKLKSDMHDMEAIVQRVLEKLGQHSGRATPDSVPILKQRILKKGSQVLAARDIPQHARIMEVDANVLITPLAMDEIRSRGIQLRRVNREAVGNRVKAGLKVVYDGNSNQDVQQVCRAVCTELVHTNSVVVITGRAHWLVAELNRSNSNRATLVNGEACVDSAERQLKPNIWLIPELECTCQEPLIDTIRATVARRMP